MTENQGAGKPGTESQGQLLGRFREELKRRRVIRVAVLYLIGGWVAIEVFSTVAPNLNLPQWSATLVTVLVAFGFVLAFFLAWAFDIGPGGILKNLHGSPRFQALLD